MRYPPAPNSGGVGKRKPGFFWLPHYWGLGGLFLLLALLCLAAPAPAKSSPPPAFLAGGDLSFLAREEQLGAVYKDGGRPRDALQIFKSHGWNVVRLRLWVHPTGQGEYINDLPYTISLAKRVKRAGLQFLLDFHYSDTWADPAHQVKPAAWKDLPFDQLTRQVKTYSRDVITTLRQSGAMPDIVQIGNETINGMLWPDGKVEEPDGWTKYGTLLKAGIAGVRDGAKPLPPPLLMIHINNGADVGLTQWFFDHLNPQKQGIDFDLIGLSYYPDGKNTLAQLRGALAADARKYHKPLVIAETAFPQNGTAGPDQVVYAAYGRTPEGQHLFLADLVKTVRETPGGLGQGVIYWQPEWVPIEGLPNYNGGNSLFDDQFNALPGLGALAPPR
jgi:arabinogalactan endo-1,4-beta-galactosidase